LRQRERIRQAYEALAEVADACLTLTTPAPAPTGFQTGDSSFIDVFSIIGCPTLSLPLLTVDGLPQGVQLTGFNRRDEQLVSHGLWLTHCLGDVS
jgi:Asp-tRNA(Asn)/Glu-tRNA(Gln) amidotransferase A subunit family amidase